MILSPPKFLDASLTPTIDLLATADRVTFIVGAGASMEAGLPSWPALVAGIFDELRLKLNAAETRELRDAFSNLGPLEAAALLRTWFSNETKFRDAVRQSLYGGQPSARYAPGPISTEIARWVVAAPDETDVATLNYDDLLERAVNAEDPSLNARGVFGTKVPRDAFPIRHLHGRLHRGTNDAIVLTEGDYARWTGRNTWQDPFVQEALADSVVVFVGLSFTDQNLLRWIYTNAAGARARVALMAREGQPSYSPRVQARMEQAADRRLAEAGVTIGRTNYYAELGQVLHEAGSARSGTNATVSFSERAAERTLRARSEVEGAEARSAEHLERWADRLQETLDRACKVLEEAGTPLDPDERLGLGLWSVDHQAGTVRLIAASDRVYLRTDSVKEVPLALGSPWVAVRAVTQGVPVVQNTTSGGRWHSVRGVPLVWRGTDGSDRIPVGAVTITSSLPDGKTLFDRIEATRAGSVLAVDQFFRNVLINAWD